MERVPRLQCDADVFVHNPANPLLATEIAFCCLHGNATEKELNLIQLSTQSMAHVKSRSANS